jgi:drug/metabolite transporter (DMT)-like permease
LAAAILGPIAWRRREHATPEEVRHGVIAGLALLSGFVLQTFGLEHTTASSSAFVTYLLVVMVPVMTAILSRRLPTAATVIGVLLAMVGLLLLSGGPSGFGIGELLTLACAVGFAAHIVVLSRTAHLHDAVRLTFWQILTVGVACLIPGAFLGGYSFGADVWFAAAFCGLGATAGAFFLMVWGQRVVPGTQAALVLLLEPVFAGVLGYASGERLGWAGLAGALLILIAILVSEVVPALLTQRGQRATLGP